MQFTQNRNRLLRERNEVRLAHLHALGGDTPFSARKIELDPPGFPQFARAHEHERG
jgi:hypothetical protein